jgi:cell wall assembly regulator SMI1
MQKFTRDLTREVEVNGERVALTLSEKGVAVRPVGSRKPPAEITWAAVVAAARSAPAAPAPAPAAPASAPAPAPAGEETLPAMLARLDAWLKVNRPAFQKTLKTGAGPAALEGLAKELGWPAPEELSDWLRWHDGQDEDVPSSLVGAFTLIDHEEIIGLLHERSAGSDGPWKAGWIPFLDDFNGSLICVDTTRAGNPVVESWRGREDGIDAAPSLLEWVRQLLADFEAGKYVEDTERGQFHKKA